MVQIDLVRIKKLKYLGTYTLSKSSDGGLIPKYKESEMLGQTVHMYQDYELAPTTHYILENGDLKMYMKYSEVSRVYSSWEEFKIKK